MTVATADKVSTPPAATGAPSAPPASAPAPAAAAAPAAEAPKADAPVAPAPAGTAPQPTTNAAPSDKDVNATTAAEPPTVYDLKLPDGSLLDTAALDSLKGVAAELKLAPEGAQKLADTAHALVTAHTQAAVDALAKQEADWEAASRADAQIGGAAFDGTTAKLHGLLDEFFPEVAADLKSSFWLKEPRVRLGLARLAAAMSEGAAPVRGTPTQTDGKDIAAAFGWDQTGTPAATK